MNWKSSFKLAENRWARSLWVAAHRYTSISCASNLFLGIWSWKKLSSEFSFLRDLLRNLILGKKKLRSFFPGQEFTYFKNWFGTIEGLSVYFHLSFLNIWGQNPYGFRIIWSSFFDTFFRRIKKFLQIGWKSRINFSEGRRQEKNASPADVHRWKNHLTILGSTSAGKKLFQTN